MTASRAIPIQVHGALEVVAAPLLIVAPFALGFSYLAGALSIALGVVLIGLALSIYGDPQRGNRIPLTAHAGFDYTLAAITIAVGTAAGIAAGPRGNSLHGRVRLRASGADRFNAVHPPARGLTDYLPQTKQHTYLSSL